LKTLWYYFIKILVKSSLFLYFKNIKVNGIKNIPNKGAVLFMVNHPNALLDPLIVAVNNPRIQHFLVRAATFKNPYVKKFLGTLNLMPIYRIRDGVKQLGKNQKIFQKCFSLLKNKEALMIFPEGSHNKKRTIRTLSKGFSRIVFGAIEKNPALKIHIIPVGLTYQNPSVFPTAVSLEYGKPILANDYYNPNHPNSAIKKMKDDISKQLKNLSVHIPDDEYYQNTLNNLNQANVNFTNVVGINNMIKTSKVSKRKQQFNLFKFLKPVIIINNIISWLLWKYVEKKIDEFEFIDTFRFGICTISFGIFHPIQSYLIAHFFNWKLGVIYFFSSIILILLYVKFHPTETKSTLG
tara:strand:+ start:38553 stop:39605 length:1053 start_codon:yes stop_codon:yes gene_type:complete